MFNIVLQRERLHVSFTFMVCFLILKTLEGLKRWHFKDHPLFPYQPPHRLCVVVCGGSRKGAALFSFIITFFYTSQALT